MTSSSAPTHWWAHYRLLVGVSLGVVLLDQWTKALVRAYLPFGQVWAPWPEPWRSWVRIVHWRNTGSAFGLYQGANDLLLGLAVVVVLFVVWHFRQTALEARCLRWGLALQVGGALGNLWDRLTQGSVTDFIAVGRFPVFNVADIAITLGVLCLLLSTLAEEGS
ncbi:MAG: signal peptidase II [Chloroflexi bacterium]|nr:signal peptidase II [Chloroflexota bacterium]